MLAALESLVGPVSRFAAITEGEESQVFRFRSGTHDYIVRINRQVGGFEKDVFAHRRFARPNLPIPAVIHIGRIENCFLCISEALPGVTLQDLSPQEIPQLLKPTAELLQVIAESDIGEMSGYGPFDGSGAGTYRSWRDYLLSIANQHQYNWAATYNLVDRGEINRVIRRLTFLAEQCPEVAHLIHGDFGSNNVLTDGTRITGVLDWSEASIGDPLYDMANVFFWRTWLSCMEQQATWFETRLPGDPAIRDRLLCYQLRIGLAEIYESALAGNADSTAWAVSRCRELSR